MKIAIYDKWIDALGGGEKVATVMAEVLSRAGHKVDLLSTFMPDVDNIEKKMSVDLSKVRMIALKERSHQKIAERTKPYDIFINTSFLDLQPSLSKKSVYYVHFPSQVKKTLLGLVKYEAVLPFLRKFLVIPHLQKGMDRIDDVYTRSGRWLDKENVIILSNPPKNFLCKFRIYSESITYNSLDCIKVVSSNAKLKLVDRSLDHTTSTLLYCYKVEPKDSSEVTMELLVKSDPKRRGLALVSLTVNSPRFLLWNLLKKYLPRYEMALYGSGSFKPEAGLETYSLFLSNSDFTKKWTKKYWQKDSVVMYPPVDVTEFKPGRVKKNMILNVGRFFVGGHSKRQDVLIDTFKKLHDSGKNMKGWELHLVGGIAGGWEHSEYVKNLKEKAKGYPIFFHFFADFKTLKYLYSSAKIYWHATGYGQSALRNPASFEHFGISVVEAMSAGCIPIVFRGGGLVETVDKEDGLTFKTVNQLVGITKDLIDNSTHMVRLSKKYRIKSKKYSRKMFESKMLRLINALNIDDK